MITCPNCGFSQPDDGYCASCGIDMKSYVPKRSLSSILRGPVTYMILLVVTVAISSFYIYSAVKEHVSEQKAMELSGSKTYNNLGEVALPISPAFDSSNTSPTVTELAAAKKVAEVVVPSFESGDLNIYYVLLASTSPVLQNANMLDSDSGIVSNLANYLTSSDPGITDTINIINLDTWSVPVSPTRVAKIFNISRVLPESDESAGLNFGLEVDSISPESVTLQGRATFVSVEAIQSAPAQSPPSNEVAIPEELGAEEVDGLPTVNGTELASDVADIQPTNLELENSPQETVIPVISLNTSRQNIISSMQSINRGDALFISNIIPRRELSMVELNLMPNLIARFINQGEFLTNSRDFVIFVEYEPL